MAKLSLSCVRNISGELILEMIVIVGSTKSLVSWQYYAGMNKGDANKIARCINLSPTSHHKLLSLSVVLRQCAHAPIFFVAIGIPLCVF